jgi:D-aspartate ligase
MGDGRPRHDLCIHKPRMVNIDPTSEMNGGPLIDPGVLRGAAGAAADRAVALVLDGRGLTGLGVVRSLGRAGLDVWLAGPDPAAVAGASRYVRRFQLLPAVEHEPEPYMRALSEWTAAQGRTFVLFCTGDLTTGVVSPHRRQLPPNVIHHLASEPLVSACLSKAAFSVLCADLEIPVPRTRQCSDEATLQAAMRELGQVFIKPDNRHRLWVGDRAARDAAAGIKGFVATTMSDVPSIVRNSLATGYPWVAQEFVAGDVRCLHSVHAYRGRSGSWTQCFVGQKLRTAPPRDGVGVLARSAWDAEAAALAEKILARMDYRGYALLQFKRDARTSKLFLIEINPRYSTWCELAERAGVNLPVVAFLDSLNALPHPPQLRQRDGVYWWDAAGDWSNLGQRGAAWRDRLSGLVPPPRPPALARLALDDPRPGLAGVRGFGRLFRRRWGAS